MLFYIIIQNIHQQVDIFRSYQEFEWLCVLQVHKHNLASRNVIQIDISMHLQKQLVHIVKNIGISRTVNRWFEGKFSLLALKSTPQDIHWDHHVKTINIFIPVQGVFRGENSHG